MESQKRRRKSKRWLLKRKSLKRKLFLVLRKSKLKLVKIRNRR